MKKGFADSILYFIKNETELTQSSHVLLSGQMRTSIKKVEVKVDIVCYSCLQNDLIVNMRVTPSLPKPFLATTFVAGKCPCTNLRRISNIYSKYLSMNMNNLSSKNRLYMLHLLGRKKNFPCLGLLKKAQDIASGTFC